MDTAGFHIEVSERKR